MSNEIHDLLKIENDTTTIFTNKELKMIDDYIKELEAYKYNMDRDYLKLEKENKILRENAEHNDKVVDKVNWENQKLKKENDEYKRLCFEHLNDKCNKLENQQKEFIKYMNKTIEELECDDVDDEELKGYLIQRIDIFKEILSKYKEIIG